MGAVPVLSQGSVCQELYRCGMLLFSKCGPFKTLSSRANSNTIQRKNSKIVFNIVRAETIN